MDYNKYLESLMSEAKFFHAKEKPNLNAINAILEELKNPDLIPKFRTIISGTAGKGTVTRYVESYALNNNLTTLTLISPHIQTPLERIRLNGKIINEKEFANQIKKIKTASENIKINPTYYEAMVLVGILLAAQEKVDLLNCEVGLGGEYDACNAIKGDRYCAITFIGNDHKEIIGPTLEDIAKEKSGIFRNKYSKYNVSYEKNLMNILSTSTKVEYIKYESPDISNKKLAKKLIQNILNKKKINEANELKLPCRFEEIESNIILDGAHSEPRFLDIKNKLEKNPNQKYTTIFAMTKSHNPNDLKLLEKYIDKLILTQIDSYRKFWTTEELKELFPNGIIEKNPIKALELAKSYNSKILVIGSFYLCGKIREEYISTDTIIKNHSEFI